jgi:hypothetical protein
MCLFNVQAIGNDIVVTYVLHEEGSPFETDGPGLGFVDTYTSSGRLLQRLEHGDWLNAPWGVALAPFDFGPFSHDLLIGQFAGGGDTQSSGFKSPPMIWLPENLTDFYRMPVESRSPSTASGHSALATSAQPIAMLRQRLPHKCTLPPDRTMAPEGCSAIWPQCLQS